MNFLQDRQKNKKRLKNGTDGTEKYSGMRLCVDCQISVPGTVDTQTLKILHTADGMYQDQQKAEQSVCTETNTFGAELQKSLVEANRCLKLLKEQAESYPFAEGEAESIRFKAEGEAKGIKANGEAVGTRLLAVVRQLLQPITLNKASRQQASPPSKSPSR
jgi:hypothetical protein